MLLGLDKVLVGFEDELPGRIQGMLPNDVVQYLKLDLDGTKPMIEDVYIVAIATVVISVIRLILEELIFKPLIPRLTSIRRPKHVQKFAVEGFKLVYYTFYTVIGFLILRNTPWFSDLKYCYNPYPTTIAWNIRQYYLWQLGFYVHSIVTHIWYESKKKDFMEMLIHHLVTFGLILFSYTSGYEKVGTMILLIHDATDVPIGWTKIAKYLNYDKLTLVFFASMVGSWTWLRLYYFPFHIIHSTSVTMIEEFGKQGVVPEGLTLWDWRELWSSWIPQFNIALSILVCLHVFWYSLFLRMAYMALSEVPDDVRSESESESETETKKKK